MVVEFREFAVKRSGLAGDSLVLATRLLITLYVIIIMFSFQVSLL